MLGLSRFFFSTHKKGVRVATQNQQSLLVPQHQIGTDIGKKTAKGMGHIAFLPEDKIEKIGSKSLLDKQWNEKPMQIIKSPHKLTEVELYKTLEKIVVMPEKRLKAMINEGGRNSIDEVFLLNLASRIPQFLTATLVNITEALLLQKDYFRNHPIWKPLEIELHRRRNNLNNQQLAAVVHSLGVTGNATKFFFEDLEETIIDSPVPIETPHLCKILTGYSLVNLGSPTFYDHMQEIILQRGLSQLSPFQIAEVCKDFSRATNLPKGSQHFYDQVEKHIRTEMAQGRFKDFDEICRFSEIIFSANVCSNAFQRSLELKLIEGLQVEQNMEKVTTLMKGLSGYYLKEPELEQVLCKIIQTNHEEFTLKQLEILIWSLSKRLNGMCIDKELMTETCRTIIKRVQIKSASMKPRGVAFAVEAISSVPDVSSEVFVRLERVVLSKIKEFIPHYYVKIMQSFTNAGQGSGELYSQLIENIVPQLNQLGYSDMIKFFELFPQVTYIYDHTMNTEIHNQFVAKIKDIIKSKQLPAEDVCRIFNILIKTSAYGSEQQIPVIYEVLGRLRHSLYAIPKGQLPLTLANLMEFQQNHVAQKIVSQILLEMPGYPETLLDAFSSDPDRILLLWSLIQVELASKDLQTVLKCLEHVDVTKLRDDLLQKYIQTLSIAQLLYPSNLDYDQIYLSLLKIDKNQRELVINADFATKTDKQLVMQARKLLKQNLPHILGSKSIEFLPDPLSDDFMNLVEVVCSQTDGSLLGVTFLNPHCYVPDLGSEKDQEKVVRRSVQIKHQILEQLGWHLIVFDQQQLLDLKPADRDAFILSKFKPEPVTADAVTKEPTSSGGRKVKRQ